MAIDSTSNQSGFIDADVHNCTSLAKIPLCYVIRAGDSGRIWSMDMPYYRDSFLYLK
jgi:hypothetical protein